MDRAGLACVLAAAVILGALSCSSSEPGQALAEETANLRTSSLPVTAGHCSLCLDIHLGDSNLFVLENYSGGTHVQGKVAAGGNITLRNFSVGAALPDDNVSNTLVAGGHLALSSGGVFGATWYGGSYTPDWSVNIQRGTATQGAPIDFAARFAELRSLSSRLAAWPSNGSTLAQWGNVYMTGTDPCLNVFEVRASDFNSAWVRNISVPAGSFVLVNIRGMGATFGGGFNEELNPRRVLYNLVDATHFDARGFGLLGTVLAPHARVTLNDGSWSGGIYAVSLSGNATGRLSPLDELAGATEEVCNGADDNCNGQVDEGFECTGSSSRSCTAWCGATGTQACDTATCGYGECTSSSCCRADADCGGGSYCEGTTCAAQREHGASCSRANQCSSGQCVDGVCCNTTCAGDCDACNLAGRVGLCSMTPSTVQCRASAGACDVAEYCTGTSAQCPGDGAATNGTVCGAESTGAWGSCEGFSGTCGESGTQSRPITRQTCTNGTCQASTESESRGCSRNTAGSSCGGTSDSGWSACSGFSGPCGRMGQQVRTVYTPTCSNGSCSVSVTDQTQACERDTTNWSCTDGDACTQGDHCDGAGTCARGSPVQCPGGLSCSNGACPSPCTDGTSYCGTSCVDTSWDDDNCGSCGNVCTGGMTCSNGVCSIPSCSGGTTRCGGACVDTSSDFMNCGSCGNICPAGMTCSNGGCSCPQETTLCGGTCIWTDYDNNNCGGCGIRCTGAMTCMEGDCVSPCPGGGTQCLGVCVDTNWDNQHCGGCNNWCFGAGLSCMMGVCRSVCSGGATLCGETCVDTASDDNNCGFCGHRCPGGRICENSTCSG